MLLLLCYCALVFRIQKQQHTNTQSLRPLLARIFPDSPFCTRPPRNCNIPLRCPLVVCVARACLWPCAVCAKSLVNSCTRTHTCVCVRTHNSRTVVRTVHARVFIRWRSTCTKLVIAACSPRSLVQLRGQRNQCARRMRNP